MSKFVKKAPKARPASEIEAEVRAEEERKNLARIQEQEEKRRLTRLAASDEEEDEVTRKKLLGQ